MPARTKPASQNPTDAAAQEGIDFILSSIHDPSNVRHCGRCLYGALLAATASPDLPYNTPVFNQTKGIVKNQTFWDHLLGFMVMKRTDKQIERLLTRFSQCNCKLNEKTIQHYHQTGKTAEPGTMGRCAWIAYAPEDKKHLYSAERCAIVVKIFCVLFSSIWDSGVKSVAKGVARRWPNTATDLVPFGPDELVQSLMQWYRFVPDPIMFSVLGAITRVCRFLIAPSLIKFKVCHIITESTRTSIDITIESLKTVYDTSNTAELPSVINSIFLRTSKYEYTVRGFVEYFQALEPLPIDVRSAIMLGSETKIMQLCSIMAYLSSDPRFLTIGDPNANDINFFVNLGRILFRLYHMHLYPRPDMPMHPHVVLIDETIFPPRDSIMSLEDSVISTISEFRESQRCSEYSCPNSLQSVGKAFQRCGRCNIVAYCSRECQTKSWKQDDYPHKRICPILRSLVDLAGGLGTFSSQHIERGIDYTVFVRQVWQTAGVPKDDLEQVKLWRKTYNNIRRMPDGSEWNVGYDDYDEIIAELTQPRGPGPKPRYMNRLARWPCEVSKVRELFETLPFWNTDIE